MSVPGWHPQGRGPEVPFLLTPGASGEHVRSSIYFFIVVLIAALLSALPVEISKFWVSRDSGAVVFALLVHQVVIMADVVRSNAWDWWLVILSSVNLYQIDGSTWMRRHGSLVGLWPWPSLLSTVLVSGLIMAVVRKEKPLVDTTAPSTTTPSTRTTA